MDSRQPSLHACDNAADCLREHKSEILEQWEARARKELRAASGKKHYLLIDSLPQFLDELIESLERQSPQLIAMKDIAQSHATQRASISDYDLDQVQAEYTILRQVIFEVIEHFADVTSHERNIILDFIVQGRVAAADEYMRLAKTQIASSQEELSLALESAEMGSFTYDIPSKRVHWSDTMIRLHGLTPEEFTGKLEDFWPRLLPEDRESIQKILSESIQHHRDYIAEYRVTWPDGSLHWLLGKGRPYYDEKGKPVRMRGTVLEITERKQFEDSLKRSNESIRNERAWYEMVLNSVPTPVILLDSESRSIFFKNDATKNLQVTIPTVLPESGTHAFRAYDTNGEIIPPEQMPRHRVLRGEVLRDFELCWETSTSTSHFIIDGTLLPAAFGHRAFGILSFRDISPIKRLEKERIQSEHELRQFMNTLSHDLKNPLSASRMTAQMIARHPDHLDRIPSLASRIIDSLSRADKMIDDLLDASRIRAGKGLPIEIEECDLTQIANNVCEEMISVHGDRFRRELPDSLIGFWSCKNIYRLIENLLSNGIKYGFHDTPVTLKISAHESMIEISVHNLGEPISPDDQKQLFDPFVRSKAVESSHRKGWGLGLTLVRGVAEAHRGRVDVQSDKKRGTTFRVTLPRDARTKT